MVKLRCESLAERWLTPGLRLLLPDALPLRLGERPGARIAAAAGGCMLVRREALGAAGGLEAMRSALIDDCALGRADEGGRGRSGSA